MKRTEPPVCVIIKSWICLLWFPASNYKRRAKRSNVMCWIYFTYIFFGMYGGLKFCRYKRHVTVRFTCLNSIVILSVTVFVTTYKSSNYLDFFISSIPTGIPSVYTDDIFILVDTDEISDEKYSVSKNYRKISTKKIRWFFYLYLSIF